MAPKRKHTDAAYSARPPKKRTPPSARLNAPQPPGSPPAPFRRSARSTRAVVNYKTFDTENLDEDPMDVADSDNDNFAVSDGEQSKSSVAPSDLSMSSGHTSSHDQSDVGTSGSDKPPPRKRAKTNKGRARPAAKSAPEPADATDSAEDIVPSAKKSKQPSKINMVNLNKGQKREVDLTLPPLFSIQSIFDNLVAKGLKKLSSDANQDTPRHSLIDVCNHVGSRPLKVATMCSGTESPLLAWDMISDCIQTKDGNLELKFEHVFSAEIVPFKQAYIERNFRPPIIFRDITEITSSTDGTATTAYGARVDIPGNVDMVIAGTACVDFSKLNNQPKTLQEKGESGDTFAAVLAYAKTHRPTMLVLENVFGAPWDEMLAAYEGVDYVSAGVLVDSKNYYLPQTRQRGYMVCIDKFKLDDCGIDPTVFKKNFYDRMTDFRRPVSSPLSSFILPNDDPLVTRASQSMIRQSVLDTSLKEVNWAKCEIRHINTRRNQKLGIARPLTNWQESGTLVLPENSNRVWFRQQVERVWDFMDMSLLRKANPKPEERVYDAQYKTRIWDVSQNIDRFVDGAPFGIAPCLTPNGVFYITDRGGPLTYTESLMLQGLPLDRISFTTETERQIQDLAGNAMSTTVVGSAIASLLISGFQTLPEAPAFETKDKSVVFKSVITSRNRLTAQPLSQTVSEPIDVLELQADACKSAAMCVCEGQIGLAEKAIQTCRECDHKSCLACGVKPIHEYGEPLHPVRDQPDNFVQKWRPRIPMVLKFSSSDNLTSLLDKSVQLSEPSGKTAKAKQQKKSKQEALKPKYLDAVTNVLHDPFAFKAFRRTSSWIIVYESSSARLELVLGVHTSDWKLYAKPDDGLSGVDELRKFFEEPVATAQVKENAFFGDTWQWRVPQQGSLFELLVQGHGQQVPSWAARLGLPQRAHERIWSELRIEKHGNSNLPKHIQGSYEHIKGTYKLLPDCGTACESLYKRIESTPGPNVFFFLDPARIGDPKDDCFVFTRDHSRLQYDQVREITATVDARWRPELLDGTPSNLELSLNGYWIDDDSCSLEATNMDVEIHADTSALASTDCSVTKALISLNFTLPSSIAHQRYQGQHRIKCEDKDFFAAFGWAMEPLRQILGEQGAQVQLATHDCEGCSPLRPEIRWRILAKGNSREFSPYDDPETAREYEHAIKSRSEPFVIECHLQGNSVQLDIGLNTATLCHRAAGNLKLLTGSVESVSWKLDTSWVEEPSAKFPPFTLLNNSGNVRYSTPVAWAKKKIELYDIQQRSLTWMKHQEEGVGPLFVVKEVEEALLPHLGWRLASEASAEVHVKGGILADHAGFGKTVTSLALIHSEFEEKRAPGILQEMHKSSVDEGCIDIAATLVICPRNLVFQWKQEVELLLGYDNEDLVVIERLDQLKKTNIEAFKRARIVILNKNVLASDSTKYLELLAGFAAMPKYTGRSTRALQSYLRDAAARVPEHLRIRKQQGKGKLLKHLEELYNETLRDPKYREYAEKSKRIKGKAYVHKKNAHRVSEVDESDASQDYKDIDNCTLLEMFQFNRLVVDEFSYTEPRELVMYCNIKAHKRWALSATPRLKDTYDVSRMARFLGINLPIGASGPGLLSTSNLSALRKDMTNLEEFESFRGLPSRTTQKSVHTLSQSFLDTFLRQNVMKPDQFPYQDIIIPITLNADNRLVYTDLSQKLNSQDMRLRLGKKKANELSVMPNVTSAEEALLYVASIFDPLKRLSTGAQQKGVKPGLQALVKLFEDDHRTAQLSLEDSIRICLVETPKRMTYFTNWVENVVKTNSLRDEAVANEINEMAKRKPSMLANIQKDRKQYTGKPEDIAKEKTTDAVSDAKAYASLTRTLRFVRNALKHERRHQTSLDSLTCDGEHCGNIITDSSKLHLSANCGHAMCEDCVEASKNLLGFCPADGCEHEVKSYHLLHLSKLGQSAASDFGSKADELTTLLKKIEAQEQQAIVFVQGVDRITEMIKILDNFNIKHYQLSASNGGKVSTQSFQPFVDNKKTTVLILNSDDESAAGANLTNANHVIFFSPLLKRSQYEYEAQMAQAIGRVRRPGQKNDVYVYRFVSLDTIDVDILEHREHRTTVLAERQDEAMPGTDFEGKLEQKLTKAQKTQFICDPQNRKFKLVPRQMLLVAGGHGVFEGTERILGYDNFSSLIKFSSGFMQDE
ncbi:hypothetical protein E4T50_15516 [Aureobasidium sp. EXF-12298]|nr:hypothetical protein E4T50_15516 [Aureobasidium sp. EXF-12298]